jgi:hypothetical protein
MHKRLPVVSGLGPLVDDGDGPRFLSQSEGGDAMACGLRWFARWILGLRDGDESPRQQVGSMAHAILADRVTARFRGGEPGPHLAATIEAERRGWGEGWSSSLAEASAAADLVASEVGLDHVHLLPDLYSCTGGPLAEVRLHAPWRKLAWAFRDGDEPSKHWNDIISCGSVVNRFAGIEGQPDLVCLPDGPGGVVSIDDYKFRQRPDLGGAADAPTGALPLPDRQGAWYLTILRALGMSAPSGFVFRQINAYAGRWLTVDDFMSPTAGELVTKHGLPTRDLDRMVEAGGMCTADVWAEAHRLLAERRHVARSTEIYGSRRTRRHPDMLTASEVSDARRHVETLRAWNPVIVKTMRADPLVCREVVRDVVVGVEGPLSMALRGVTPARHLQTYSSSPCMRRWGCPVASPCQSSLGAGGAAEAMLRAAQDSQEAREAAAEVEAAYA